jgi:hypothetical protein
MKEAGLPLNEIATFLASLFVNLAVAVLLFMVLGGRDLLRRRVEVTEAPGDDSSRASEAGTGESQPPSEAAPRVLATSPSGPRRPTRSSHSPRGPTSSSPSPGSSPWPR